MESFLLMHIRSPGIYSPILNGNKIAVECNGLSDLVDLPFVEKGFDHGQLLIMSISIANESLFSLLSSYDRSEYGGWARWSLAPYGQNYL